MVWTKLGLTKQRLPGLPPKKLHRPHLSKRHYLIAGGAALLAAALASSAVAKWGSDPVAVPEHTRIHVVLDQAVSTNARPGHRFRATVSKPVVIEGKTVIPKGAHAEGVVVEAKEAGRVKGRARLLLALQSLDVDGQNYPVHTYSSRELGHSHMKHHLLWIGGGAGGGVLNWRLGRRRNGRSYWGTRRRCRGNHRGAHHGEARPQASPGDAAHVPAVEAGNHQREELTRCTLATREGWRSASSDHTKQPNGGAARSEGSVAPAVILTRV